MNPARASNLRAAGTAMLLTGWLIASVVRAGSASDPLSQTDVFVSGTRGYHTYRIPALVVSGQGTVLAFCEGRKNSGSDTGEIDLLLKRSSDGGHTWSEPQVIWSDDHNVCGNPCPVVDRQTGTIWLLLTWNRGDDAEPGIIAQTSRDTRRVFVTHSTDDGRTWAGPKEITPVAKLNDWTWYATGPGAGIQVEHGPYRGRLVIPCDHIEAGTRHYFSHVIFSDDHGNTWKRGGSSPKDQVNECEVVELTDHRLMLNMRNYDRTQHARQTAISQDGGASWTDQRHAPALVKPICQASIRRGGWPEGGQPSRILFSNPAGEKREKMTLRVSYDEGATWPVGKVIHAGPSAYSCLAMLPGQIIGCLYECGNKQPYERIVLAQIPLSWLEARQKETLDPMETHFEAAGRPLNWNPLPPLPDPNGFASPFAGVSGGALILAGGANFPHGMPWEGGKKVWSDSIFVLPEPDGKWVTGFKLPRPIGYGVSVTTDRGVICAGGSNGDGHFRDVFALQWVEGRVEYHSLPPLPAPMANGCGARVGQTFYVAGGIETPDATNALRTFWALDLSAPTPDWRELAPWPGPARMLAVAGAQAGAFYLFSGAELHTDANGKTIRNYLRDAYCFKPGEGWKRLSDLPRPAVAAPSPAVLWEGDLLVISGDDGKRVNFEPKAKHPGFPKDMLAYDPRGDKWTRLGDSPLSRATAPAVEWRHRAVILNGELHPGVRTPEVWCLPLPKDADR